MTHQKEETFKLEHEIAVTKVEPVENKKSVKIAKISPRNKRRQRKELFLEEHKKMGKEIMAKAKEPVFNISSMITKSFVSINFSLTC